MVTVGTGATGFSARMIGEDGVCSRCMLLCADHFGWRQGEGEAEDVVWVGR
jgi:hypothetical protein